MKIAISADGSGLDASVGHKLGTSRYLIIVDPESGDFEAVSNPGDSGQRGAGIQAVVLVSSKGVSTIITGYCSPAIKEQLRANGIEVLSGVKDSVRGVLEKYRSGELKFGIQQKSDSEVTRTKIDRSTFVRAARGAAKQFVNLFPMMAGVVLLTGLFNAFVPKAWLTSIFAGNPLLDTLWGACFGSILAGNPINSYVIGGELLQSGVSLFAVTTFMLTWVTVGMVQLPAEIAALGKRFALLRNGLSFLFSIPIALVTVLITNLIIG